MNYFSELIKAIARRAIQQRCGLIGASAILVPPISSRKFRE